MLTLTEFKRFLEIDQANASKDELLLQCIQSAIKEIDGLTNRYLEDGSREETIDGSGAQFIFLGQFPVTGITELKRRTPNGFTDIINRPDTISDSVLLLNAGKICLLKNYVFPEGENAIMARYSSGYMAADEWAQHTKYSIGDTVIYLNTFYSCLLQHQSTETFEPEYWEALNSEAVPADLKKAVTYLSARNFFDSPAGKNLLMKKSESTGGAFSRSVIYKDLELEHIINRYKKQNI